MHDLWVPITLFLSFAAICITYLTLHFKYKQRLQDTLKLAIEQGQTLSAETVNSLLVKNKPFADLKKGVLLIALGFSVSIFMGLMTNNDVSEAIAFGVIPVMMGLAYIVVWKLRPKYDV